MSESELREAQELVQDLGELPLALDQAGAYICSLQIPVSAYRERLKTGLSAGFDEELLDPSLSPYKSSVLKTWELSFQELSDDARHLLHMCAFLSNEDIPEELFRRSKSAVPWITEDKNRLDKAIRNLFTFSLAKRKDSNDSLWIHRLVHTWAREHTDIASRLRNAEDTLALVGSAIVTDEHKRFSDDWMFERRILSHLKICEEHIFEHFGEPASVKVADASFAIAVAYLELGYNKQAKALCQRAIDGYEKVLGRNHPSCLDAIDRMGYILYTDKQYDDALNLYREALAGREKVFGSEHSTTFEAMNDLANVLASTIDDQGFRDEALPWYERALTGLEKVLGKDHPETLSVVRSMGSNLRAQQRYDDAFNFYQRVLVGSEKALGEDHPSTLDTIATIASMFHKQKQYDQALEWYQKVLVRREKTLGEDHCSNLDTIATIASKRYAQAIEWYQKTLVRRETVLREDHTSIMSTIEAIASIFRNQQRYDKALGWFQKALVRKEKALGEGHPSTLGTIEAIALIFRNQQRFDEAIEWFQKALVRKEKTLGENHPSTLGTVEAIASILHYQKLYDEALE
ncbi:hypothetical protein RUND412_001503 [Rhizina undulata]